MDYNDKMGQYTCENNGLIFAWDDTEFHFYNLYFSR